MNFEYVELRLPLRVIMVNPLLPEAQMFALNIFKGLVFGFDQLISMTLLVYSNEVNEGLHWIRQVESTSASCFNSIQITTNLPLVSDGDVFVIHTNLKNPNIFEWHDINTAECFDSLYLLLKVASNLVMPEKSKEQLEQEENEKRKYFRKHRKKLHKRKPIFMCDGLVAMDIVYTFSTNIPSDSFFCPTPVPAIATSILGDHLKVLCSEINRIHMFGANDKMFHIEYERPLVIKDIRPVHTVEDINELPAKSNVCEWDLFGSQRWKELNLDYTSFNASWMKKEFIDKVRVISSSNLHGPLFNSARMTKALKAIWYTRNHPERIPNFRAVGAISDGSLGTTKGLPYIFPLNFYGDTWKVNTYFADDYYVKAEINKYNKVVQEQHKRLIPYCKKFLVKNVIKQKFVVPDYPSSSSSTYATNSTGSSMGQGSK